MRKPRLLFGSLQPGPLWPFLLLPHNPEGGDGGGGAAGGVASPPAGGPGAPPAPPAPPVPTPPAPPPAPSPGGERGFPQGVAPEQMTVEQQAAYWRWRSRSNEEKGKEALAWRQANESKVSDYDRLVAASQTEQEKAIAAATAKAAADGRAELLPHLVTAEFLAAAKGALTREQVTDLLAPLDKAYFLDAAGKVDTAKVADYVSKVAPGAVVGGGNGTGGPQGGGRQWPDTGQGHRGGANATPSVQSGRDLYARLKNPAATSKT